MAKKKRNARRRASRAKAKAKKPRFNPIIIVILAVLVIIALGVAFYSPKTPGAQIHDEQDEQQPTFPGAPVTSAVEGICQKNNQCFITYCKDEAKRCVNTTQLTGYSSNCKTYSDWVTDVQDYSKCACVQNVCKML